jgi:hypothetical protein
MHKPRFTDDVPESEREKLRELVRAFLDVRFDANDVVARAANLGTTNNLGHVAQALTDLEERGEIREIEGTNPPEWVFVET